MLLLYCLPGSSKHGHGASVSQDYDGRKPNIFLHELLHIAAHTSYTSKFVTVFFRSQPAFRAAWTGHWVLLITMVGQPAHSPCALEVVCSRTTCGDELFLCGGHEILGAWEVGRALKLYTEKESFPVWKLQLPATPTLAGEFKLLVKRRLEKKRVTCFCQGTCVQQGEAVMFI